MKTTPVIESKSRALLDLFKRKEAELEMLRAFARRHGCTTADGAYVAGNDPVYYCTCEHSPATPKKGGPEFKPWPLENTADQVEPIMLHSIWFSTPEAAEAHARKEWES